MFQQLWEELRQPPVLEAERMVAGGSGRSLCWKEEAAGLLTEVLILHAEAQDHPFPQTSQESSLGSHA